MTFSIRSRINCIGAWMDREHYLLRQINVTSLLGSRDVIHQLENIEMVKTSPIAVLGCYDNVEILSHSCVIRKLTLRSYYCYVC